MRAVSGVRVFPFGEKRLSVLEKVVPSHKSLILKNAMTDTRFAQAYSVMAMNLRSIMCGRILDLIQEAKGMS